MDCITNTVAIVAAIFIAEGGDRARVPYGILSVKPDDKTVLADPARHEAWAKRICENTVKNNLVRWKRAGRPGCYIDFLADKYCPKSSDPVGNKNWKSNVKRITKHKHR